MPGLYHPDYSHRMECALGAVPGYELVRYQSTFGPNTLLTPIDAMALRKLYGGSDVEGWAREEGLYPAGCPAESLRERSLNGFLPGGKSPDGGPYRPLARIRCLYGHTGLPRVNMCPLDLVEPARHGENPSLF